MRNGQNNKRMRNRNNNNNNNNNNRRGQNPMTRVFESNGPDIKIRGTASHVAEKYVQLARDARSSGDPVAAENYYQHAEHYFRIIAAAQEQFRQNQPQPRVDNEISTEEGDDEAKIFRTSGKSPVSCRSSRSRSVRDNGQPQLSTRPASAAARTPRAPPAAAISAAAAESAAARDRRCRRRSSAVLHHRKPAAAGECRPRRLRRQWRRRAQRPGERFPRRRRRPHGPRPDNMATQPTPSEDFNPGNE